MNKADFLFLIIRCKKLFFVSICQKICKKQLKKAEIGLWLLEEFWGKGILKEIMPKLFERGFNELELNRIEGYVVSNNSKCKKVLEKINFTYEGTMREMEIKTLHNTVYNQLLVLAHFGKSFGFSAFGRFLYI